MSPEVGFGTRPRSRLRLGVTFIRMFTAPGEVVLDNAFGSGSFLVAAAMEGRRYIGIEQNTEVHLFKEQQIDYLTVARERLREVEETKGATRDPPSLFSEVEKRATNRRRGPVDVDEVVGKLVAGVA